MVGPAQPTMLWYWLGMGDTTTETNKVAHHIAAIPLTQREIETLRYLLRERIEAGGSVDAVREHLRLYDALQARAQWFESVEERARTASEGAAAEATERGEDSFSISFSRQYAYEQTHGSALAYVLQSPVSSLDFAVYDTEH